ncbi:toprim domain-containing protein [Streptomyces parvus]|uniref:toprim domain-containing protein n=1 Tax=Streptomyces parvus TaxID=66428 RepID=UPI00331E16FC
MTTRTLNSAAYERVIAALNDHGSKGRGTAWQCVAHEDRAPSLSVTQSSKGVLINCHAGCATEDVVTALNLTMSDLFDEPLERRQRPQVVAEYSYCDEAGELLYSVRRIEPGYNGERKTFRQYAANGTAGVKGVRRVLYRLPEVIAAAKAGDTIIVVEGEKDADSLAALGVVATCNVGGAGKWSDDYTKHLRGASEVVIIADRDEPGRKHAETVAASVKKIGIPARVVQAARGKDVSDHLSAGLGYDDLEPVELASTPADDSNDTAATVPHQAEAPETEQTDPYPGRLPETFYNARPLFQQIRQYAHAEAASADTSFFMTLARLSGMVSHHYRAVTGIGGRASLNIFAASVGGSGAGKSTSVKVAKSMMPSTDEDFRDGLPLGSGEGMAEVYMGNAEVETGEIHQRGPNKGDPVVVKVRKQVRHNAFFYVDEGETIAKLADRNGSTLGETLRRAAIGETLGQANATEERTRYVEEGSYSMGLMVGFQPKTAMPLLADSATGTPQRFLWCWAEDNTIPYEEIPKPDIIRQHPGQKRPTGPVDITFPEEIRKELRWQRVAKARGELQVSEMDAHGPLMKVKVAALLALLDNREFVRQDDWDLAEVVWQSSCAVRDALIEEAKQQETAERARLEEAQMQQALRTHSAKSEQDTTRERIARTIHRHVVKDGPMSLGNVRRKIAARDRGAMQQAVDYAEARGWISLEDGTVSAAS